MNMYPGITQDAMWLLAENRFHDSKAYYEEHKPQIRRQVIEPLKALAADLAPAMLELDPQFITDPNRNGCVSRVRRDTRYTRDKSLYRENMWVGFMRDKRAFECTPGFYVDISPRGCSYGMGFYYVTPRLMQLLRKQMDEKPAPFAKAVSRALRAGFAAGGDSYAKPKREGLPFPLDQVYNRKIWEFSKHEPDPAFYASPSLPDRLTEEYKALYPLYRLMIAAVEKDLETGGQP